jgi:hypothetical protein
MRPLIPSTELIATQFELQGYHRCAEAKLQVPFLTPCQFNDISQHVLITSYRRNSLVYFRVFPSPFEMRSDET